MPEKSGTGSEINSFLILVKERLMNIQTTPALIMRIKEFGESDLLVTFFTPDNGQLKGVAKGGKRSRKRFVNCLDHFCLVNLEYGAPRKGELQFLHSGRLLKAHERLRSDYRALTWASYMVELTESLFPLGVAEHRMFELLKKSFEALTDGESAESMALIFEARAMALGGYAFNFEKCCQCRREYKGEGLAVFVPEKGGISCLRCQAASLKNPKLTPEVVRAIKAIQSEPLAKAFSLTFPDYVLGDLKRVFALHREYHLGLGLKSLKAMGQ